MLSSCVENMHFAFFCIAYIFLFTILLELNCIQDILNCYLQISFLPVLFQLSPWWLFIGLPLLLKFIFKSLLCYFHPWICALSLLYAVFKSARLPYSLCASIASIELLLPPRATIFHCLLWYTFYFGVLTQQFCHFPAWDCYCIFDQHGLSVGYIPCPQQWLSSLLLKEFQLLHCVVATTFVLQPIAVCCTLQL